MPNARENAEQKGLAIVLAAQDLFLDQGYATTSMDTIAQVAGVTKQTIYRYYPSKEALFGAVMQHIRASNLDPYHFSTGPLKDELISFGVRFLAFHLRPEALGLYRLMLAEGSRHQELFNTFQNIGPRSFSEPLIQFLKTRSPELDNPGFVSTMFCSMILSARNNVLIGRSPMMRKKDQHKHVNQVVELIVRAIPT